MKNELNNVARTDIRVSAKALAREKANGFSVNAFDHYELFRDQINLISELSEFRYDEKTAADELLNARATFADLKAQLLVNEPFTVRYEQRRSIRLTESDTSNVLGVDYESRRPTNKLIAVEHHIEQVFDFNWHIFGQNKAEGEAARDEFQRAIYFRLGYFGTEVVFADGAKTLYKGIGASASHQKKESLIMALDSALKTNEEFFWFGKTEEEFMTSVAITGAELWKARANLLRPHLKKFKTKRGETIHLRDILFVKDVSKIYALLNARTIGQSEGGLVSDGAASHVAILGDGAILFLVPVEQQGQATMAGVKGMAVDATSSIEELCRKHGISIKDFLDKEVEGIDGRMHRVGDYKAICGEGCWKFDKAFNSFDNYVEWLERMATRYPGIDELCLLRQAEEVEDEAKVRRLTRTLIQQWMFMSMGEMMKLTANTRRWLKNAKSFEGVVNNLAAMNRKPKNEDDEDTRTETNKMFELAPWIAAAPAVQAHQKRSWERKVIEAASGKFRTQGQYPYIMQDTVALLEVWVLGMDPNSPDLGILKGDEVSAADVADNRKLLVVRFPANFLTAKVMINKACKAAFASLNGVMAISVHSDILIRQDGDVDGDEGADIYDKQAIELTERMIRMFNPPVVLFKHGSKAERFVHPSKRAFIKDAYDALWRAKKFDSVGLYANLATRCCYLAAMAYRNGKHDVCETYLKQMSAASTGAIMAIDQVKGNQVDEALIAWLDEIGRKTASVMQKVALRLGLDEDAAKSVRHPFIQKYVSWAKGDECNNYAPENPENFLDQIAGLVLRSAGEWEGFASQGVYWDAEEANRAMTDHSVPTVAVQKSIVTKDMLDTLRDNWFKTKVSVNDTTADLSKVVAGSEFGFKDLVTILFKNERAASYRMNGTTLAERRAEYYDVCRRIIDKYIAGGAWVNKFSEERPVGYVYSEDEKKAIVANYLIRDALELKRGNGVEDKGSYAMFVLNLYAKEIQENIKRNGCDSSRFLDFDAFAELDGFEASDDEAETFEVVS